MTSTVDSLPLIVGSILSKKLAAGSDAIVLDVKSGSGAIMHTEEDSIKLAETMVEVGALAGKPIIAVVSGMEQPLGTHVGNALEVKEAIDVLAGKAGGDLLEVSLMLGGYMLLLAGQAETPEEGQAKMKAAIDNGAGLKKLKEMIAAQGGDPLVCDDVTRLPQAKVIREVTCGRAGYVQKMDTMALGMAAQAMGAGRLTMDDKLDYSVESNYDGQAQYFREAVADELRESCKINGLDLYTSGLKIYTTIDTRMQKYAEEAAVKQMKQVQRNFDSHWGSTNPWQDERHQEIAHFIEDIAKRQPYYKFLMQKYDNNVDTVNYYMNLPHKVKLFDYENGTIEREMSSMDSIRYMVRFMHCGFVAIEPQTGHVKAWVGDIDFKHWKYDKVTAMRQPGSTFKLFVYTEAMNQGMTPCDTEKDEYFAMNVIDHGKVTTWAPTNANGRFSGALMPLKSAFAQSINSVAVRLGQKVGINNVVRTAHAMGINSELTPTPALALGSSDVNLLELVNSYATVANDGMRSDPVLVTRVVDRDGNEVYKTPKLEKQAIAYRSAFLMQQMLMGGMREPGGTSMSLWTYVGAYPDTEFGGKTGTSNNHSDAWFVGVSPKLVCGAWVGGEYRSIHFRTGALGQGSRTALPICGYFLQSVLGDPAFKKYHGKFAAPRDGIDASLYSCQGVYYAPSDSDSIMVDSLDLDGFEYDGEEIPVQDSEAVPVDEETGEDVKKQPLPQNNGDAMKPE